MDHIRPRRHHTAHQIEKEEELVYKRSLLIESNLLQSDVVKLMTATEEWENLHFIVQSIQSIAKELTQKLGVELTDAEAEQESEPAEPAESENRFQKACPPPR